LFTARRRCPHRHVSKASFASAKGKLLLEGIECLATTMITYSNQSTGLLGA